MSLSQTESVTAERELIPQEEQLQIESPEINHLVTEDDTPVDNFIQEKLQRFLVECLYSSLKLEIPFLAAANVGLFYAIKQAPLVPDVMLSLEVAVPEDWSQKKNRSYFAWELGKLPEVAIEIVSNKKGEELGSKLKDYARAGVAYYVVFEPLQKLGESLLRVYGLREGIYTELENSWMEQVGLGLTLWQGEFEGINYNWLRWCDREGNLLLTGNERATEVERLYLLERQRAERLASLLRDRGIDPQELL
ncbi:MAG: Uma2 family endonuclease [Symploca sp. SIO2C1]|nr:Uma2 family endonuclease [Symploca sp. SIO2C1]